MKKSAAKGSTAKVTAAPIADPTLPRSVVNYILQRRRVLTAVHSGRPFEGADVCDADHYLLKAARFHGVHTTQDCPVCRREQLTEVTYIFGDELGHISGAAIDPRRLLDLAERTGEFRVFVVEVCTQCRWNYLTRSYVLGDGVFRRPPRRPPDLLR
ncbi:MAG: DUF5318 family protein [Candidatus Nanopelagicales bacterium]|jgi:hypothetical protein